MGFLDDAKAKLGDAVHKHGDTISGGIDKAARTVDQRTGGKHATKIQSGAAKAKDALHKLDKPRGDEHRPDDGGAAR